MSWSQPSCYVMLWATWSHFLGDFASKIYQGFFINSVLILTLNFVYKLGLSSVLCTHSHNKCGDFEKLQRLRWHISQLTWLQDGFSSWPCDEILNVALLGATRFEKNNSPIFNCDFARQKLVNPWLTINCAYFHKKIRKIRFNGYIMIKKSGKLVQNLRASYHFGPPGTKTFYYSSRSPSHTVYNQGPNLGVQSLQTLLKSWAERRGPGLAQSYTAY